jgi:hypothetical protein
MAPRTTNQTVGIYRLKTKNRTVPRIKAKATLPSRWTGAAAGPYGNAPLLANDVAAYLSQLPPETARSAKVSVDAGWVFIWHPVI